MVRSTALALIAAASGVASAATFDFTAYTNNSGNTAGISTSATLASTASTLIRRPPRSKKTVPSTSENNV